MIDNPALGRGTYVLKLLSFRFSPTYARARTIKNKMTDMKNQSANLREYQTEDIVLIFIGVNLRAHLVSRCPYLVSELLLVHI